MSTAFLRVKEITKRYGDRAALRGISFEVDEGEVVGIFGPNGAGKSTTMRILAGIVKPTSGEFLFNGDSVFKHLARWHRFLGVALDDLALFEYLTLRGNLELSGQLYGIEPAELQKRIEELVEFFALGEEEHTIVRYASHGTRKKLALALSILHGPKVLLLDESLNGIDAVAVRDFRQLVRRLRQKGTTVILTSHALDSIEPVIDRCVMMTHGQIVFDAPMSACTASDKNLEQLYMEVICGSDRKEPGLSWL